MGMPHFRYIFQVRMVQIYQIWFSKDGNTGVKHTNGYDPSSRASRGY